MERRVPIREGLLRAGRMALPFALEACCPMRYVCLRFRSERERAVYNRRCGFSIILLSFGAACDVRNLLIGEVSRWGCRCCSHQDGPDFADFASQWFFLSDFSTNSPTWRGLFAQ